MSVRESACVRACVRVGVYTRVCACVYVSVRIRVFVCACVCVQLCMRVCKCATVGECACVFTWVRALVLTPPPPLMIRYEQYSCDASWSTGADTA